jgi:NitT/TauT family transport system substrate-binding protein
MKKMKLTAILMVLVLAMASFSACSSSEEPEVTNDTVVDETATTDADTEDGADEELVEFTIAFSTWVGYGPFFIAEEMGYFEAYGIAPTLTIIDDESQFAAALASNAIQGLAHVLDREVIAAANKVEEKVVLALDQSSGGDGIISSAEILEPTDLVGKTVALDKSSTSYFFFLTVLEDVGISEDEMTILDMGADAAGTAFVEGEVDAAVTWEPWLTNASEREGGHLLVSSADYPGTIVDVVSFNQQFVDEHPEAIKALVQAWYDAIDYYAENPDAGNEMMANGLAISVEDTAGMATGVTFYGREENPILFNPEAEGNLYDVADLASEFWLEKAIIDEAVPADELLTSEYLD